MSSARRGLLRFSTRGEEVAVQEDGSLAHPAELAARPSEEQIRAAEVIVEEAQGRAEQLVRESAERAAVVEQDAYRAGLDQGYRDGQAQARAELVDALALVQQIGRDAKAARDLLFESAERETVELVIASTRAVLGEHARLDEQVVVNTIRRALERAGSQNVIRLRVSPDQHELVMARLSESSDGAPPSWEVSADGSITVGGCIVDTERGEIDARLDVQLDEVARTFRALAGSEPVDRQRDAA